MTQSPPTSEPLADADLEIAAQILLANRPYNLISGYRTIEDIRREVVEYPEDAATMLAKARELCGYNAGAWDRQGIIIKLVGEWVERDTLEGIAAELGAFPIPPDSALALREEVTRLRVRLKATTEWLEDEALTKWKYVESPEFYSDGEIHIRLNRAALSAS